MGWQYEEYEAHEGGVVVYVVRDVWTSDAGLCRELGYPRDDGDRRIARIAAGCDCGWRSPRWVPHLPATWAPFSVATSKADGDRARALWRRHFELNAITAHPLAAADVIDLADARAAATWRKHATAHEQANKDKPWGYPLIPHDAIADNMTLDGLAKAHTFAAPEESK